MNDPRLLIPALLAAAWLLPLGSFALIALFGPRMGRGGRAAGSIATGAAIASAILSLVALGTWLSRGPTGDGYAQAAAGAPPGATSHAAHAPGSAAAPIAGQWYALFDIGALSVAIDYYIDGLTLAMFVMVGVVASCIHVYSFGYMHEELHPVTDPAVMLASGEPLRRPGRFHRFYQYLSLFLFSMLGLVLSGNVAMVFMFWELVGICSYLLIGFYFERPSASAAGNKAFVVNRVGDFGMIVGLMAIWSGFGTFSFADRLEPDGRARPGIFSQVRAPGDADSIRVPDGMVALAASDRVAVVRLGALDHCAAEAEIAARLPEWRAEGYGYGLLLVAGLGIFCGCVGKSAQVPLHVWLPDAMEGPTPVSALIHAATMVAAGVYLVGRFYPVFAPEVLLVIACVGCATLLISASIALVATDIKRVLAYSTVSQLGYMMLALGTGGWLAGMFHLFTHALFKSLLFLCSGSVIHACQTNDLTRMGGLRRRMPVTAYTMLVGCLAIVGAGIPATGIGLSGYYSKDAIVAQVLCFAQANSLYRALFHAAVLGAGLTALYMFRMWFLAFAGRSRDAEVAHHVHESPRSMLGPLVVLAALSVVGGWSLGGTPLGLEPILEQARPAGTADGLGGGRMLPRLVVPGEHHRHAEAVHVQAEFAAFGASLIGLLFAVVFYAVPRLDPADVRRSFAPVHRFLAAKWYFDDVYDRWIVRPLLGVAQAVAQFDRRGIDAVADALPRATAALARWDAWIDRMLVDRAVDALARRTHALGLRLCAVQTGKIRHYVLWAAAGAVAMFVIVSMVRNLSAAGF